MGLPRITLLLTVALLAVAPAPAVDLQRLVANSPFAPAGTPGQAGTAAPLEFRGVFLDQDEHFFSVYNPATKASVWVGLNEAGQEFFVRSYDEAAQSIVADFKGRSLTLSLSKAPAVAAAAPAPAPTPAPATTLGPFPVAAPARDSTEAKRLADLAAEIRRRREMRKQAAPPPGTAAPAPASRPR